MNYAFGLWEKRCGSYFDTDWFNLHRVKSDSDHPNPTGQIITLHIPFTQEQTDTLTEGQPGPFYTKGVYSISFGQRFRNRKKCCNLTCANTIQMMHCYRLRLENVLTTKSWNMWDSTRNTENTTAIQWLFKSLQFYMFQNFRKSTCCSVSWDICLKSELDGSRWSFLIIFGLKLISGI